MTSAIRITSSPTAARLRRHTSWSNVTNLNAGIVQRLLGQAQLCLPRAAPAYGNASASITFPLYPAVQPTSIWQALPTRRPFHSTVVRRKEERQGSHDDYERKTDSSGPESDATTGKDESGKDESHGEGEKEAPPPPPHGDKTPWQVFTETLSSEFKKSKEWNESTKALASSAHQFTESESVKRARAAYEAASGAASSKTSSALKSTGRAIGQGAAWTWESPVVRGVRKGVTATGKGIEKVTKPVRETQAYKTTVGSVKEAIDDGSSSRYGGWIEKEERRKQRQIREQNEAKTGGLHEAEKMEADPKWA